MDGFQYNLMLQALNNKKTIVSTETAEKFIKNFMVPNRISYKNPKMEIKEYRIIDLTGRRKRLAKVLYFKILNQNIEQTPYIKIFIYKMRIKYGWF